MNCEPDSTVAMHAKGAQRDTEQIFFERRVLGVGLYCKKYNVKGYDSGKQDCCYKNFLNQGYQFRSSGRTNKTKATLQQITPLCEVTEFCHFKSVHERYAGLCQSC